jgi:hypothetical protein
MEKDRRYKGNIRTHGEGQTIQREYQNPWRRTDDTKGIPKPMEKDRRYKGNTRTHGEGQTIQREYQNPRRRTDDTKGTPKPMEKDRRYKGITNTLPFVSSVLLHGFWYSLCIVCPSPCVLVFPLYRLSFSMGSDIPFVSSVLLDTKGIPEHTEKDRRYKGNTRTHGEGHTIQREYQNVLLHGF